jgi:SAM-dependent methyltransferase
MRASASSVNLMWGDVQVGGSINYFDEQTVARLYDRNRPYFHPLVVQQIRNFLKVESRVPRALDIGCGTGQSTIALRDMAHEIIGVDNSHEMLRLAKHYAGIRYVQAAAEGLPFHNGSFDLITVGLAFHWFDRARFLSEMHRLLRPAGWLIIYNNGFSGRMKGNPAFEVWHRDTYLRRYPTPPRNDQQLSDLDAETHGYHFVNRTTYSNDVEFTREGLVGYLLTQSNVIAALAQRTESEAEIRCWLADSLKSLFVSPIGKFEFGGYIWYLQSFTP